VLLGTSGTTGEARAVIVSYGGLGAHAVALTSALGLSGADKVLTALPLAHSYGCRTALLVPLLSGAEVVLVRRFSAHHTLALIESAAITWAPVVPTMLSAWAAVPGGPCRSLRWVLSAGAPLADAVRRRAEARLGCAVREGYGLTEASISTIDLPTGPPTPGTVGRPLPGVELRLDPGTREVQIRGVNVMAGYLDDPEGTRAAFTADGWLRTGDVGAFDAGGNLRIVERIKDVILSGGHTIYPAEVEAVLARHPSVLSVAVVGRPDLYLGEVIVAHVVLAEAAPQSAPADLTEWSKTHLVPYKVPREVVRHTELPLGPSGKVLKRRLRAGFWLPDDLPGH
jgi:long-chain acyl-CoA synthetase